MALALATPMKRKTPKQDAKSTESRKTCTIRVWQSVADMLQFVQNVSHHRKVELASEILETELKKRMPKIAEELRKQADRLEEMN